VTPPTCDRCDGILKPDVVFFGDNVDRTIVQTVYDNIDDCDALLVIGSSLKVFSGYRFCRYAAEKGKPIASINPGVTRADDLMELTVRKSADDILPDLASRLIGQ
jgi:NAD-dependent SIR2 family protein deacetylase